MEIRQSSSFQQNIPLMVFRGRLEVGVLQGWGLGGLATIWKDRSLGPRITEQSEVGVPAPRFLCAS
jgi:hypothetical protein